MQSDPTRGSAVCATRPVSQWERALLAQWFAGTDRTGDKAVAAAYVSQRSDDDPRLRNMIVIAEHMTTDVSYLIHRPIGTMAWVLTCGRTGSDLGRYRTLPEALHTIRPSRTLLDLLPLPAQTNAAERFVTAISER
jgi:hypothetical protein